MKVETLEVEKELVNPNLTQMVISDIDFQVAQFDAQVHVSFPLDLHPASRVVKTL